MNCCYTTLKGIIEIKEAGEKVICPVCQTEHIITISHWVDGKAIYNIVEQTKN